MMRLVLQAYYQSKWNPMYLTSSATGAARDLVSRCLGFPYRRYCCPWVCFAARTAGLRYRPYCETSSPPKADSKADVAHRAVTDKPSRLCVIVQIRSTWVSDTVGTMVTCIPAYHVQYGSAEALQGIPRLLTPLLIVRAQ